MNNNQVILEDIKRMIERGNEWQHLNTAPRHGEFLAHSRKWKRPRFIRRVTGGEYRSADGRKVIPEVWFDLPKYV